MISTPLDLMDEQAHRLALGKSDGASLWSILQRRFNRRTFITTHCASLYECFRLGWVFNLICRKVNLVHVNPNKKVGTYLQGVRQALVYRPDHSVIRKTDNNYITFQGNLFESLGDLKLVTSDLFEQLTRFGSCPIP